MMAEPKQTLKKAAKKVAKAIAKKVTKAVAKKPGNAVAKKTRLGTQVAVPPSGPERARSKPKNAYPGKPKGRGKPRAPDLDALRARLTLAVETPACELAFKTPFELLTATILAAQSTDKTVNQVMPTLLLRFPGARELAASDQEEVETLVKRTGFFRNKAKAIRGMAQKLVAEHDGEVPRTIEQMVALPGVARKTANVVLGTAYGIGSGFVVDTHVTRVAQRLALSSQSDPVRIEQDLCRLFAQSEWVDMGHRLILHGRYTCLAQRPMCDQCPLNELCPSRQAEPVGSWEQRATNENVRVNAGVWVSRGS
jgi:endonuclease-3